MSHPYHLRSYEHDTTLARLEIDATEAESTVGPSSSPPLWPAHCESDPPDMHYAHLVGEDLSEDDESDLEFILNTKGPPKYSEDQKALACLKYLGTFSRFSLRSFLMTIFTSEDPQVKAYAARFAENAGFLPLLDIWWKQYSYSPPGSTSPFSQWAVEHAGIVCAREFSFITDRASAGPYMIDATALRVPSKSFSVDHIKNFKLANLISRYDLTLPSFQHILRSIIGKEEPGGPGETRRDPADVRVCLLQRKSCI